LNYEMSFWDSPAKDFVDSFCGDGRERENERFSGLVWATGARVVIRLLLAVIRRADADALTPLWGVQASQS
jgi:hypothetical protein